ncbi:MAG: hypothetical protein AB2765_19900, partial [Candidatus Thiodiazotropha endolucinida]
PPITTLPLRLTDRMVVPLKFSTPIPRVFNEVAIVPEVGAGEKSTAVRESFAQGLGGFVSLTFNPSEVMPHCH